MPVIIATLITLIVLGMIFTEKLNHTIAAAGGAALMVIAGMVFGFYSETQALEAVHFGALGLLLGMMILTSLLAPTGIFQYIAIKAGQLSHGNPWLLLLLLATSTAFISLFFNNVTTIVLVGPIAILITELLGINPIPILMALALLSDTADVGTSVGDPASVLVASASGYTFSDFLTHAMPVVIVASMITLFMLRYLFRIELAQNPPDPDLIMALDADEALEDRKTAYRVLIVLGCAIVLFIFQSPLNISSEMIALSAASVALLWVRPNIREVLVRVDWPVLLFFTGLFVIIGGLEAAGAFTPIAQSLSPLGHTNPRLLGVVIIWVVAALSALVDNVPVTIAMISLLHSLSAAGVDVNALWWAVVFGAGFGGNATKIGSGANILIVSLAEQSGLPITTQIWTKRGLPVAIATCIVGSILFYIFYYWFG